jgi:uncharacterized protein (TIGR03790 family)
MTISFESIGWLLIACLTSFFIGTGEGWAVSEVEKVVVLANTNDAGSIEIANYYVRQRGIPPTNIIALPMPTQETMSLREYVDTLHNPLLNALIERDWVRVVKTREPDFIGRERVSVGLHTISYLVTTRGVPLRIADDVELLDSRLEEIAEPFRVNQGSVDSELALLIGPSNISMTSFVQNPLFAGVAYRDTNAQRIIRVSRLDGPSVDAVKKMVDRTLQAEAEGLMGRAYFDMGGPHDLGDQWIRAASELARAAFFDTDCETTKRLMDETDRFDAPAIYMGWYQQNAYGPWSEPRWPVPPGAVGFHLHSDSANTVRSANGSWLGAFVKQGYCATMGNVYEPYLECTHHPDILLEALLEGRTFGEAVMLSNPVLSWQGVAIGDPLYRPFKVNLSAQLKTAENNSFGVYALLREINRLEASGETDAALLLAQSQFRQHPSLPLADKLAQLYTRRGEAQKAVEVLKMVCSMDMFGVDEVMLAKQIADFLSEQGEYGFAFDIYQTLIKQSNLSDIQSIALLEDGSKVALKNGNAALSFEWIKNAENLKQ